ncbi:MAG: stage 0 sporulation protein [Nitrospiraceae bacterium]|nr:stage 0 sporulation protein [Nitrospiraceae bacterium]
MQQIVRVRLRKSTRVMSFVARDIPLNRGDACIVRTDRGLEYGTCAVTPEGCPDDREKRPPMSVVRKANYNDENTHQRLAADEEKARALCVGKIEERGLPMQLVDVEYTFDRRKVIFYFTAEERVDFRELVRDLAHELRMRIELRHIQVRDKAKLVGGLAACGREVCCATWMPDFMPISMKMAKRQNLSLNPTKISGQCGRLMCCLSYENDQYEAKRKKKPSRDQAQPAACAAACPNPCGREDAAAPDLAEAPGEMAQAVPPVPEAPKTKPGELSRPDSMKAAAPDEAKKPRRRPRRRRRRRKPSGPASGKDGPSNS